MSARILLLEPPVLPHAERDRGFKEFLPHVGIGYIAGVLRAAGHLVRVIDAPAEGMGLGRLARLVDDFRPALAGIAATTYQIHDAAETARTIHVVSPRTRVVVGGYHATARPAETLDEFPSFDFLAFGEGEGTALDLVRALDDGVALASIPGLAWRDEGSARANAPRPPPEDLDALPFPAFDLFPLGRYRGFYTLLSWRRRPLTLNTSRGCPYRCSFCFRSAGPRVRRRSVENVMEEIERDLAGLGADQLVFTDEIFGLDRDRAMKLCEAMASRGVDRRASWVCQSRADRVDPGLLAAMRRAGCAVVSYGIEAGNQGVLDRIHKDISLETAVQAIGWTRAAGISADTNFILGHPYETRETILDTIRFARRLAPDSASFALLSPFPGTEVAGMAERGEGGLRLLSRDWRSYGKQIGSALELEGLPRPELERLHRLAYLSFYARPSRVLQLLRVVNLRAVPAYCLHNLRGAHGRRSARGGRAVGHRTAAGLPPGPAARPRPLIDRVRRWLPPVAWMGVIYTLSAQSDLPTLIPGRGDVQSVLGHLFVYAILALLWRRSLRGAGVARPARWALVLTILYGVADELHQAFVPGRHPSVADLGVDTLGATAALFGQSWARAWAWRHRRGPPPPEALHAHPPTPPAAG